jgi:altronate dehydratase small subunit
VGKKLASWLKLVKEKPDPEVPGGLDNFLDIGRGLYFNQVYETKGLPAEGEKMKDNILIINGRDNVAVALKTMAVGEVASAMGIEAFPVLEAIPASHKIALRDISEGEEIIKYGEIVAVSIRLIKKGCWVHTHNLESKRWKR